MKRLTVLMLLLSIFCYFKISSVSAEAIGVWLFDEGDGKIVKDVSGNEHHGEIVGEVAWAGGKFGTALEFDGGSCFRATCGRYESQTVDNDSMDKSPEDRQSVPSYCWKRGVARSKLYDVDPSGCDDFWIYAPWGRARLASR